MPEVLHATLRDPQDDPSLTIPEVLKDLRAVADKIEKNKREVSAEERQRVLPLLIIMKRLTKRKTGYHKALASIRLNASTVRSWFYRGYHTDEIIAMLEPEPEPVRVRRSEKKVESGGGSPDEDAADIRERFLLHADRFADAVLRDKTALAKRLAREYQDSRKT